MTKLLVLAALLSLAWGWEPNTQYVYKYTGRSFVGIHKLKNQNAVIELQNRVTVQSVDENTLVVKLSGTRIKRNGNYQGNAYFSEGEDGNMQEIEGEDDYVTDAEILGAPFSISHNKGSITGIKIGADEPQWIVNYKKAIASQLQLDVNGVRHDGPSSFGKNALENESRTITVNEDSVTGDCSTTIDINPLPLTQIYSAYALNQATLNAVCSDKPVYQIVKTKDFSQCKNSPVWHTTTSTVYNCDFDKANCGDFLKRSSVTKYVACGDLSKLTIVHGSSYSNLVAQPFATKAEELVNAAITNWALEKQERIGSVLAVASDSKVHKSLSYIFGDFEQSTKDGAPVTPNLSDAYYKNPASVSVMRKSILDSLRDIANDLKERSDADKDKMERLAVISRLLMTFSLEELRNLWDEVRGENCAVVTLFIDCAVVAGSNPTVMLIKELIESKQLSGYKATFAMAALGFYVKTPTRELLRELVSLLRSNAVQSSKTLFQTGLMTVSDLLNTACKSRFSASKRFPASVLGDFCESKDSVILNDFLPLLTNELVSSQEVFDRIVALSAFGSLGIEEIVPILLPVIRGTPGKFDDSAERLRAILSLHRVAFTAPKKIHPILTSLASNVGERPEIRMTSIALLLLSNAPQSTFQKLAAGTWFEPSRQVASFINTLIHSLAVLPASTSLFDELSQKARVALPNVKSSPFGLPFSMADIRSNHLDEGITTLMYSITHRDSDQMVASYASSAYYYQIGPLIREPFTISMYTFNMAEVWAKLASKIFGRLSPKYSAAWTDSMSGVKGEALTKIWDELKASPKPADKRAGLLHVNLLGSINSFINLEKFDELIPQIMADAMKKPSSPLDVGITKYRMLGEYNVRFASELGLPVRYLFTLPMFVSMRGAVKGDGKMNVKSVINAELSWKITGEVRVDIPFNGNHIATGVDVLVDSHSPENLEVYYNKGQMKFDYPIHDKVIDLIHYHVKPYTFTRTLSDSVDPTIENQAVHLISVTDQPFHRETPFAVEYGLNLRWIEHSELAHNDKMSWYEYFAKWDINSISNMGFVPLDVRHRKFVLRFTPNGSKSKLFSHSFFYQYAAKADETNLVYETGTNKGKYSSDSDIVSYSPIIPQYQPIFERLFTNFKTGNGRVMSLSVTSHLEDGTVVNLESVLGIAMNARYTQDSTDWQVRRTITKPNNEKETDFGICYKADRDWNNPPTYGFSKDVLTFNEVDHIGFGPNCEYKVKFTAKVYRDEDAARAAIESSVAQQCLKDMESGFKHGSPACTEARRLDHLYNNYELLAEAESMSDPWVEWARSYAGWMNQLLEPFIVSHTKAQRNTPFRASWNIKRNPQTGDSDMIFVRPHETVVAKEVRWTDGWPRFSPLSFAFAQVYYPLYAGSNFLIDTLNLTSAGVSESKCYVGSDGVYTFDGAHYKYTVDRCSHVLMTDCYKKSELAILAKRGNEGQKIVTVIYGKDTFELDPLSHAIVNGAKTGFKDLAKGSHIEIRSPGAKSITVVIFPLADGGVILDIRSLQFFIKVQGSHVELSAPVHMRGRACGLCGDFNQEVTGEFKTADRCALSSGDLMAASFKLSDGCSADENDISRRLKRETETCSSVDKQINTYLPDYDVSTGYKEDRCSSGAEKYLRRGESMHYSSGANVCTFP